jgi:hypothetical protein
MLVVQMSKLKSEEKETLEAFDTGRLRRVKNADKEIAEHRILAEETFKKAQCAFILPADLSCHQYLQPF